MQVPLHYDIGHGVFSLSWNHISSSCSEEPPLSEGKATYTNSINNFQAQIAVGSRLLQRGNKVSFRRNNEVLTTDF